MRSTKEGNNVESMEMMAEALPAGTPLMAKTQRAAEIFGVSVASLYRMRQRYPDFRALTVKTGKDVLYDVPRCYAWFGDRLGTELEA